MPIIMFTGTGRTGKTVVVNNLVKRGEANDVPIVAIPSVVRGYMQSQGLTSEADFYALEFKERKRVQIGLIEEYFTNLDRVIANEQKDHFYLFDRAPFDHFGYAAFNGLTVEEREKFRSRCHHYLIHHCRRLIHFPWPCPWTNEKDSDAFRHYDKEKEEFVSSFIKSEIDILVNVTGNIKWRTESHNTLSPQVRSDIIYTMMTDPERHT